MTKKIVPFQYQPSGILPDDSKDFTGLTQEEYEFLLWDIEQMIEWVIELMDMVKRDVSAKMVTIISVVLMTHM